MNYKQIAYIIERNSKCYCSLSVYTTSNAVFIETDSVEPIKRLETYLSDCNLNYSSEYDYNNRISYKITTNDKKNIIQKLIGE